MEAPISKSPLQPQPSFVEGAEGKGIDAWFGPRHETLWELLGYRYILFGEWCHHVHSVQYDLLPDTFVAFDVFDRREGSYLSAARRDQMLEPTGIRVVRGLRCPRPLDTEKAYRELLYGPDAAPAPLLSRFSTQAIPVEGVYLRVDDGEHLRYRAKIVRGDFIQMIEEGGRWEKKKAVIQQCDTEDWGYFSALLCNGSVQCVHAPTELERRGGAS